MTEKSANADQGDLGDSIGGLDDLDDIKQKPGKLVDFLVGALSKVAAVEDKIATLGEKLGALGEQVANPPKADKKKLSPSGKDEPPHAGYDIPEGNWFGRNPLLGSVAMFLVLVASIATMFGVWADKEKLLDLALRCSIIIIWGSLKAYAKDAIAGEQYQRFVLSAENNANKLALAAASKEIMDLRNQTSSLSATVAIQKAKIRKLTSLIQNQAPDLMDKTEFLNTIDVEQNRKFFQNAETAKSG